SSFESDILRQLFLTVAENYRRSPAELDPGTLAAWYSLRTPDAAQVTPEERGEWIAQMHEHRSLRLRVIDKCQKALEPRESEPKETPAVALSLEETEQLMTVLNDHRLLVATQQEIGQLEMDL